MNRFPHCLFTLATFVSVVAQAQPAAPQQFQRPPSPQEQTYTANCASCHGTDLSGGRAPSLFNKALLDQLNDDEMHVTIREGIETKGMPAFASLIPEEEIAQLLTWIRLQSGNLADRPVYVPDPDNQLLDTLKQKARIEVFTTGLDTPWGASFLPDGRLLVTERPGRIRIIDSEGRLQPEPVKNTPEPWVRQDGGYFDIVVHPDHEQNGWIYLSFSELSPGFNGEIPPPTTGRSAPGTSLPPSNTAIVRGRINAAGEWVDQQDIVKIPESMYSPSIIHYGSRFLFDDAGHLFWTLGDRGNMANAQDLGNPMGKIHRINDDGSIPQDNPFVDQPGAWPSIWSWGNRNPEGLSFDPVSGLLWESEHGPTGGDEINIIEKGKNYGWGVVSMGSQPGITRQHDPAMEDPVAYYTPSIGPSGISFYTGDKYPGWKDNSLFVTGLVGQKLLRLETDGRNITGQETIFEQYGRTRQIIMGPDGLFYLLLQNPTGRGTDIPVFGASPGMVIRLQPVE